MNFSADDHRVHKLDEPFFAPKILDCFCSVVLLRMSVTRALVFLDSIAGRLVVDMHFVAGL